MDQKGFEAYAKEVGVDVEGFTKQETPKAIVIDQITYEDGGTGKFIETKSIESEVGKKIDLLTMPIGDMENKQPELEVTGGWKLAH